MTGKTISHYRVLERIGQGGMGVVYKAEDTRLHRTVALKFLNPDAVENEEMKARFLHEARAAASLDHPNICTVHEICEERGHAFLVMGYVEGESVSKKLDKGPMAIVTVLDIALQVADGLCAAHKKGIIHRDIKSANVMLDSERRVKILDFGLAQLVGGTRITRAGTVLGTPAYMSPEQIRGEEVDERTDIWSLGVLLYEMLAGQLPFSADHQAAATYRILNEVPKSLSSLRPEVPSDLERITFRALSKKPEERFRTADELIRELKQVQMLDTQTVAVQRTSPARSADEQARVVRLLPEGERVQVTVVVAKIRGYIDLVEQLSPEEVDCLIQETRALATDIARQHGGLLNQFSSEEIVLAFGIASAHEDHFARAARAAVALHAAVRKKSANLESRTGCGLYMNSGIDTGRAAARQVDEGEQAYQIVGEPMKVAASLALHAEPDEILLSGRCQRLLAHLFETEACARLRLQGTDKPITPYRLGHEFILPQDRFELSERFGLQVYVGRDTELETLRACLARVLQSEGQFVSIVGEAGLGKSRLVFEFRRRLPRGDATVLHGRCRSQGSNSPFHPFIEVLRNHLLPGAETPNQDAEQSVVARLIEIDKDLEPYVPIILRLLTIPSDAHPMPEHVRGEILRSAMLEALSAVLTLSARDRPLILVLEDWHWSDEASREALNQLVELIPSYGMFIVVTTRPEYERDWGGCAHHTQIRLRPLTAESSSEIIESVLSAHHLPEEFAAALHERTGGNPFFLEEICRALRDEGIVVVEDGRASLARPIEMVQLPVTVQATIRARLHRLEGEPRHVLRIASAIGQEFQQSLLQHVLGGSAALASALKVLRGAGLLRQTTIVGDPVFQFTHALVQDVAYDGLLQHQRKTAHRQVGEALEALNPLHIEEQAGRLAYHFSQATDWPKAVRYGVQAAGRCQDLSLFTEALALLERVEEWLREMPEDQREQDFIVETLLKKERLCEALGQPERQEEIIDVIYSVLKRAGDSPQLAEAHIRRGDLCTHRGRYEEAEAALQEALRISRALPDEELETRALRSVGYHYFRLDRFEEAVKTTEELIIRDRRTGNIRAFLADVFSLCADLVCLGEYDRALSHADEVLALPEAKRFPERWCSFHSILGDIYRRSGDDAKALYYYEQSMSLGSGQLKVGGVWKPSLTLIAISNLYLKQGNLQQSLRRAYEAVELGLQTNKADERAISLRQLGTVLLRLDRYEEALPRFQEAAKVFSQYEDHVSAAQMCRSVAMIHESLRDLPAAVSAWEQVRVLERRCGNTPGEIAALEALGRTVRRQDLPACDASEYYRMALSLAGSGENQAKLCDLHNTVGILAWQQGDFDAALTHYREALRICQERGDRVHAGLMLNSIGVTLHRLGQPGEALLTLQDALDHHKKTGERTLAGHALATRGDCHFDLGQFEQATHSYEESLHIRRANDDQKGEGWMLQRLARVQMVSGEKDRAHSTLAQALKIADHGEINDLKDACRRIMKP